MILKHCFSVFILSVSLLLCACSSNTSYQSSLTPMGMRAQDPSDNLAIKAINTYIDSQAGPKNSRYDYSRIDLNNDGLREAIFLFKSPYHHWCGWAGCIMAIFQAEDNGFTSHSIITNVRGPLIIADTTTQNWRDLIIRVSGTNLSDRTVKLSYDGKSYPSNPSSQTDMRVQLSDVNGIRLFP